MSCPYHEEYKEYGVCKHHIRYGFTPLIPECCDQEDCCFFKKRVNCNFPGCLEDHNAYIKYYTWKCGKLHKAHSEKEHLANSRRKAGPCGRFLASHEETIESALASVQISKLEDARDEILKLYGEHDYQVLINPNTNWIFNDLERECHAIVKLYMAKLEKKLA